MHKPDTKPSILIRTRKNDIHVYKLNITLLGNPPFITFYWGRRDKVLFIAGSDYRTNLSFEVFQDRIVKHYETNVWNTRLVREILSCSGWEGVATCRVFGEFDEELGMVAFPMREAVVKYAEGGADSGRKNGGKDGGNGGDTL